MYIIFNTGFISTVITLFALSIFSLLIPDFSEANYGGSKSFENNLNNPSLSDSTKFDHIGSSAVNQQIRQNTPTTISQVSKTDDVNRDHTQSGSHTPTTISQVSKTDDVNRDHTQSGSHTPTTTSQVSKVEDDDKNRRSSLKKEPFRINEILQNGVNGNDCSQQFFTSDDSDNGQDSTSAAGSPFFKKNRDDQKVAVLSKAQMDDKSRLRSYTVCK